MKRKSPKNMSQKTAIITGGSRGLGRNSAINLARKGIDVILTYHSNQKEADSVVAEIVALGRKAVAIQLDTGNVGASDNFAANVRQALSGLGTERFAYPANMPGMRPHTTIDKTPEAGMAPLYNFHSSG